MSGLLAVFLCNIRVTKSLKEEEKDLGSGITLPLRMLTDNWWMFLPSNGGWRDANSYSKTPSDQMSDLNAYFFPSMISGDSY